jgi:predicted P-loop ATPase/GTPase
VKILASIEVERIQRSASTYTFRAEVMEVEVIRVMRRRADSYRNRYYYEADVKRPARMHPDARSYGRDESVVRVNIVRKANPTWKPPVFPEGRNVLEVPA